MRILHTSDWHLGRTLHGVNLHEHQRAFHDFLLTTVQREQVDAVVIAGDVFDRSVAPVEAVKLLDATLVALAKLTTVILTPGNHDSAVRLGFGSGLMRPGIHVLASTDGIEHPVSVTDDHGEVLFFGLPFLDPDVARYELAEANDKALERSHLAVMNAAMNRVRAKVEAAGPNARSVVLAHTFVSGGSGSDSERDLTVGGVDSVPGSVFAGVDYVALGHLHGCQNMARLIEGERPVAWYSGSPLAFSFSEATHTKAVLLVDMDASGACEVTPIPTPVPRRLTHVRGTLAEVIASAEEHGEDWAHVTVVEESRPPHLQETLRAVYPHMLVTEFESTRVRAAAPAPAVAQAAAPGEVVGDFFEFLTGARPDQEQEGIVEEILSRARVAVSEEGKAAARMGARR